MFEKELIIKYIYTNKNIFLKYLISIISIYPLKVIAFPKLVSILIDFMKSNKYITMPFFLNKLNISPIIIIILAISFLWIIIIFLKNLRYKYEIDIFPDYQAYIRKLLFNKTINKYSNNYKNFKISDYITRIESINENILEIFKILIMELIPLFAGCIFVVISIYLYNSNMGLLLFFNFIITSLILFYYSKKTFKQILYNEKYFLKVNQNYNNIFSNMLNIYLNNTIKRENNNLKKYNNKDSSNYKKQLGIFNKGVMISSIMNIISLILIFNLIYINFINKKLTKGSIISVLIIIVYYITSVLKIFEYSITFLGIIGKVYSSEDFLNNLLINNKKTKHINDFEKGYISFNNIYFRYPNTTKYVFNNFSLNIKNGIKTCIIGRSGSGKSTLLKLLLKIYKIDRGDIKINNININSIDSNKLREKIIYINQNTDLFDESIIKNILYGTDSNLKFVENLIKQYKLDNILNNLQKNVGTNGSNLSLGMQKIIIILRGILRSYKAQIIIFDEPLTSLDKKTRKNVIKLINNECINKTVMIITHNNEFIPHCSNIINLNN